MMTSRFGEIDIEDNKILNFRDGLPGLDWLKKFTLISSEETKPFLWFQSVEGDDLALPVINPLLPVPDYSPWVPKSVYEELGITVDEDILMLTVVVIPKEFQKMTTNLMSPIIVNVKNNEGKQVILDNSEYELRRPIFDEVAALIAGGDENAGSDT